MFRKTAIITSVLLTAVLASPIGASPASAARGNRIVQPGDRIYEYGRPSGGCTVGPVVAGYVFTADHCGSSTTRNADGVKVTLAGQNATIDAEWFQAPRNSSTTISTSSGDIPTKRVIEPWAGMAVSKSGWISGVTAGTIGFFQTSGFSIVNGMKMCKGDSGSAVYTSILGNNYVVGMATGGSPPNDCKDRPTQYAGIRDIDQICQAAGITACRTEAGRPIGGLDRADANVNSVTVSGWTLDPSSPAAALTVRVLVDGVVVGTSPSNVARPDLVGPLMLNVVRPSGAALGYSASVTASPGSHRVCVDAVNVGQGTDEPLGCATVNVPVGPNPDDLMLVYPWTNGFGQYEGFKSSGSGFASVGPQIGGRGAQPTYAGDFNGDGRDDVLLTYELGRPGSFAAYEVFTSNGSGFNAGQPWIRTDERGLAPTIVVGNFNGVDGDGVNRDDLMLVYPWSDGFGKYEVFISNGSSFVSQGSWISGRGAQPTFAGDFNGDGRDDVLLTYEMGGRGSFAHYEVFTSTGTGFNAGAVWIGTNQRGLAPVVVGNFNGTDSDGVRRDDIMLVYPWSDGFGKYEVFTSNGSRFASKGSWISGRGAQPTYAGDFNGDGRDDVLLTYEMGGRGSFANYEVFTSTGSGFNSGRLWIGANQRGLAPVVVGNFQ